MKLDNEITLKTLRKTMKWAVLNFIRNPQGNSGIDTAPLTITFINYIHGVGGATNVMKLY